MVPEFAATGPLMMVHDRPNCKKKTDSSFDLAGPRICLCDERAGKPQQARAFAQTKDEFILGGESGQSPFGCGPLKKRRHSLIILVPGVFAPLVGALVFKTSCWFPQHSNRMALR